MRAPLRLVGPIALLCCACASTVQAQIYALRQADGTLVLSDKPLGPNAQTFAVQGVNGIRTTAAPGTAAVLSTRASRYDAAIEEQAAAQRVRPELVRAVIQVESAYNPRATSRVGAMGLMQLMPGTAADLGVLNAYDPQENIRGGVTYLRQLLDRFDGNEELALAAYNAGPNAVTRYGDTIPPYRETRQYVQKIRARTAVNAADNTTRIYKVIQVIGGREVPFYSNVKPTSGKYQVVVTQPTITTPAATAADDSTMP